MPSRRPLTHSEQVRLIRVARRLPARDGALITCQMMTGFRVSEILRLTVNSVWQENRIPDHISLPPRMLKGGRGRTRRVPMVPELRRALERHLHVMARRIVLTPELPLFLSREVTPVGDARALSTESVRRILRSAFTRARVHDDGRLGTHSLRKGWAMEVYQASGRDPMLLRTALHHQDVRTSQAYIEVGAEELERAMRAIDFTRAPRRSRAAEVIPIGLPTPAAATA